MVDDRDNLRLEDDDDGLDETVADVELDEALDRVDPAPARGAAPPGAPVPVDDPELGDYDPEAGQSRIADKSTITGQIMSEAGLFIMGLCASMLGLSVLIYAVVMRSTDTLIAAAIICPPTLIWAFLKWRRWLGGAPYVYRLLLSLNEHEAAEEALEMHRERQKQRVAKRIAELESKDTNVDE